MNAAQLADIRYDLDARARVSVRQVQRENLEILQGKRDATEIEVADRRVRDAVPALIDEIVSLRGRERVLVELLDAAGVPPGKHGDLYGAVTLLIGLNKSLRAEKDELQREVDSWSQDGAVRELEAEVSRLQDQALDYQSRQVIHASSCSVHNDPMFPPGPCSCHWWLCLTCMAGAAYDNGPQIIHEPSCPKSIVVVYREPFRIELGQHDEGEVSHD